MWIRWHMLALVAMLVPMINVPFWLKNPLGSKLKLFLFTPRILFGVGRSSEGRGWNVQFLTCRVKQPKDWQTEPTCNWAWPTGSNVMMETPGPLQSHGPQKRAALEYSCYDTESDDMVLTYSSTSDANCSSARSGLHANGEHVAMSLRFLRDWS